jgi:hypothetical protein
MELKNRDFIRLLDWRFKNDASRTKAPKGVFSSGGYAGDRSVGILPASAMGHLAGVSFKYYTNERKFLVEIRS